MSIGRGYVDHHHFIEAGRRRCTIGSPVASNWKFYSDGRFPFDLKYQPMAMLDDQRPFHLRMIEGFVRLTFGGAVRCSLFPFRKSEHEIIRYAMYARLKTCFD